MKTLKNIPRFFLALFLILISSTYCNLITTYSTTNITEDHQRPKTLPFTAGVLLYDFNDLFTAELKQSLENLQRKNEDKVKFTFFDGKGDFSLQHKITDKLTQNDFDLLLLNMPAREKSFIDEIIYKAKQRSIPVILFNTSFDNIDAVKSYKKSIIINSDIIQSGVLQGKILVDAWNANKKIIDKNGDNKLQYIMLKGRANSTSTIVRTKYSIETINAAEIQTEELASIVGNWDKNLVKDAVDSLFFRYGSKIEAIIANNDAMAIGAIEVLQKYGYNTGNKFKTIQVVGIDAIPEAQKLIQNGYMLGSVYQDTPAITEAILTVGMNLVFDRNPLDGTNYKLDETGVVILIPNKEYTQGFTS